MVAAVSERGYAATSVTDLVTLSGVSRRTFYKLFADKQACFEAAISATLLAGIEIGLAAEGEGESWEERASNQVAALARTVTAQPAAARMCLIEAYSAGPSALATIEAAVAVLEQRIGAMFAASPERSAMPPEMIAAFVGAGLELARSRLIAGQEADLEAASRKMMAMIVAYRPPPEPLRLKSRVRAPAPEPVDPNDPGQRAIAAFASLAAERGYEEVKIKEIVRRASMSPSTFYAHFAGKEDVLMAAIDSAGANLAAAVLPAFRRATAWPQGVRAAYGGIFNFLAARPALARLLMVEVYAAGPKAVERREEAMRPLEVIFAEGRASHPQVTPFGVEALRGFFLTLAYRQIRQKGTEALPALAPLCTYMTLAPFIGADEACEAANGDGQPRSKVAERVERGALSRVLVVLLKPNPSTIAELAEETKVPREEVERAIADLEALDLIGQVGSREGSKGGEPIYKAMSHTLEDESWHNLDPRERQRVSAGIIQLLIEDIEVAVQTGTFDARPDRFLARVPLFVDEEGWRDLMAVQIESIRELLRVQSESAERIERTGRPAITGRSMHAMFEMPKRSA